MINAKGTATVKSASTGEAFQVTGDDLDWECTETAERGMGAENTYEARVEFQGRDGQRVACTWLVYEYPVGAVNHTQVHRQNANVDPDFESFDLTPD